METIYADGTPIASCLEGNGFFDTDHDITLKNGRDLDLSIDTLHPTSNHHTASVAFAPPNAIPASIKLPKRILPPLRTPANDHSSNSLRHIHDVWSTAINSRLRRADNQKFLEHFRYIIVASQLLNEYLDQGAFSQPPDPLQNATTVTGLDGAQDGSSLVRVATSPAGVASVAVGAFACASLIHWIRLVGFVSKRRIALILTLFSLVALLAYTFFRRHWLKYLRRHAVDTASDLTASWQSYELSTTSALSFIQEVELVSKGYKLSTPLPPVSRIEESGPTRRCARLRKALHKSYAAIIPACVATVDLLTSQIDDDDLDKYYDIYDINVQDAREASGPDSLSVLDDDPESLKSLRVLSFRAGVLRRVTLCHLMSLPADGGKPDVQRWRRATETMSTLNQVLASSAAKIGEVLREMETLAVPVTPGPRAPHTPTREKMRSQVRKISTLSSGIRGLQAKMQILREETNRSIEQSDDLTDLGPELLVQYESIGADLKDLMQAWESGKASLQTNLNKQERRISMASSGLRSPVSSLGGLTAVDEDGSPADALRALTGDPTGSTSDELSNRSSMVTTPSEEEVFEAIAMPRQRPSLSREERIAKMYEERERQATLRAKRDANTSMLKELETVITLRPKMGSFGSRTISTDGFMPQHR